MLRDATRGQGGGGLTHPALSNALPSLLSPPSPALLTPPLSQRHVRTLCQQRVSALSKLMHRQLLFLPFPSFCSPHCSPFVSSLHRLHSSTLYFPLPSLYSVTLHCTFSSGRYKGRSCWRERACVISGCTWAPESYCLSWKSKPSNA